jgi:outer membrane protein assembly factor BamB
MKRKMPKNAGKVIPNLIALSMLFLLGLGCGFDPYQLIPEQTLERFPPAIEGRIISQSFSGSVVWHRNDILIRRSLPPPELLAGHGRIAFVNFLGGPLGEISRLDVLDANTGATLWQSERFADHETAAISKDRAFVLLNEGSPLNVYDIQGNHKPLHSFNYFNEATLFYMSPTVAEENIYIYYYEQGSGYAFHSINLEGQKAANPRRIQVTGWPDLFLFNRPFFLVIEEEGQYTWNNLETGEELWRIPAPGRIDSWPVLQDGTLIISAGDGLRYLLMAIDTQTGHKLWETEKVFGPSVALYQDSLYALRNDGVLTKLDFTAGRIQEEIPFEPASINPGKWAYLLASDGERLFVYFGDSQELFALKIP